jgi:hypothetical protein
MKYYSISNSADINVIGKTYPQSQQSIHHFSSRVLYTFYWNPNLIVPKDYIFPYPILDKRAILTDLISHSGLSIFLLLVSEKLKNILEEHSNDNDFYFFETIIKTNNGDKKYWGLIPLFSRDELINFESSVISRKYESNAEAELLNITDLTDYKETTNKEFGISVINIEKVLINNPIHKNFFALRYLKNGYSSGFIVSEHLKNIILNSQCTGLVFDEL